METREIHLDCQSLSGRDREQLLALGYYDDPFKAAGGGLTCPPHHLTWEISGLRSACRKIHQHVLNKTVALVSSSLEFIGYVEAEVIAPEFHTAFPARTFQDTGEFPLPKTQQKTTTQNKVADIHIKVPLRNASKPLEGFMASSGIYFVETPKSNRIYTLQFLSHSEGRETFRRLEAYFALTGGVTEVTYEVCSFFLRKPNSLPAPTVIEPGTLLAYFGRRNRKSPVA